MPPSLRRPTLSAAPPTVDAWFAKSRPWSAEVLALREILQGCGLDEALKWGKPTYMSEGANIVLIMPLKATCTLLFMKGVLLDDPKGLLVQAGENSQSQRQARFSSLAGITAARAAIRALVAQAMAVERAGTPVAFKTSADLVWPVEFTERLDADAALRAAFDALTPGRRRQYHLHFTGAKQSATRSSRVERAIPRILAGQGLTDR